MDSLKKAAELLSGARVLVFDFDGTLVDSNSIKWRAFEACFSDFPDQLPEILAYCRSFNHTPRDVKFRHIYETILRRPYGPDVEQALLKRFGRETTEPIVEAAEIPGAEEFLRFGAAFIELFSHPGKLGALSGENVCFHNIQLCHPEHSEGSV